MVDSPQDSHQDAATPIAPAPGPQIFDGLADSLTVSRASGHGQAEMGDLWASLLQMSPPDFVRLLTQDLPAGSRAVVIFANEGAVSLRVKTPQMLRVVDGDMAPGGEVLFLRRLGAEGALARDSLSRLALRNIVRFARRQGVTRLEVYPDDATLATWLAAGFTLRAERWQAEIQGAFRARLSLLKHLTRDRGELSMLGEINGVIEGDEAGAVSLATLAAETRTMRQHPLSALCVSAALPKDLLLPPALQNDPGVRMPRFTLVLALDQPARVDQLRAFLTGGG